MTSFFEGHADFVPDATQSFGDEFGRWAASQNLVEGTPQFEKQKTVAASQTVREEYFTPRGRARLERFRRQREHERLEEEREEVAIKTEVDDASEDDSFGLKEDDRESVVSLDVGFSQAFTSDNYLEGGRSEDDDELADPAEECTAGQGRCDIKIEPTSDNSEIDLPQVGHDSDDESVVSIDQGLSQVFPSSTDWRNVKAEAADGEDQDTPLTSLNDLTEEEQLLGWQALCRETGRTVGETIQECRTLLKQKPYINIIDYIDAARIGAKIESFDDFATFCRYTRTTPGKRINLTYAKEDELLTALLQRINRGPGGSKRRGGSVKHHSGIREKQNQIGSHRSDGKLSGPRRKHPRCTKTRVRPY